MKIKKGTKRLSNKRIEANERKNKKKFIKTFAHSLYFTLLAPSLVFLPDQIISEGSLNSLFVIA